MKCTVGILFVLATPGSQFDFLFAFPELASDSTASQNARAVAMRQVVKRFPLALAIALAVVASVLGAGRGLPGLTLALRGADAHVCTCASGGDHATCPICNGSLREHRPSRRPAADAIPCGDPRVTIGAPSEVSTLAAPLLGLARPYAWVARPLRQRSSVQQIILEPSTPPPRAAAT
jgi:hypothetical protein